MKKLTFSDVEPIILALSDTDVVLVGGQAIAAWCNIYNLEMAINAITRDIDFYGGSSAVENANNKLKIYHSKAYYPDLDDNTPNSGKISCMLNNDAIEIDFMYSLTGLSDDEIESSSVTVELQGKAFKILHPWLCLQSKIVNLAVHIGKRDNEGIEQARLSVEIMHAFLVDLVKEDTKSAIKFCEKIFKFCERESSLFANNLYKIDSLKSIPIEHFPDSEFKTIRYAQALKQITEKRNKFTDLENRKIKIGQDIKRERFKP